MNHVVFPWRGVTGASFTPAAFAALFLLWSGCSSNAANGNDNNAQDAQVSQDGEPGDAETLDGAQVSGDASGTGGGAISIYVQGDHTPKTFDDGLSGQTPTSYVIALSEYWIQTSLDDPSPVFCFERTPPVEADMSQDTLAGICQTAALPSAVYTHGRVKVEWATYTVTGTLHYSGMPLPGELTFFRAYSDTTYLGEAYLAGEGTITFTGATEVTIPTSYDPPQPIAGIRMETIDGSFWMTFPYSTPLAIDESDTRQHWARFWWEVYEGFRWEDADTPGYVAGTWDVTTNVSETETVIWPGVTGYHTTASTDP